jgi:dolichyl-phosphate beta-glucosyltransferase
MSRRTDRPLGLVVPLFDEEERFPEFAPVLVRHLAGLAPGSGITFVDDGSTDGTAALVERVAADTPGVTLLRRPHAGKGAAVAAGLLAATQEVRAFCDLDLSTPLDQLDVVVDVAARSGSLALGSRDLAASRLERAESPLREALGRTYNRLLQLTVTPGVVDTQCGAKAAPGWVWEAVLPLCLEEGYAWDAEVISVASALGIGVQEVPIAWSHDDRSKVNVGRDGLAMVAAVPRIWLRSRRLAGDRPPPARPGPAPEVGPARSAVGADGARSEVFAGANVEKLMDSDRNHWWFRSKAALVATALRRTGPAEGWLVDAGGGAGGVTALLGWYRDRIAVVEGSPELVGQARSAHGLAGLQGVVDALPLADRSVSVLCLLDVIEHLDDPVASLQEAERCIAADGRVVVNVPSHQWLWSAADEELGHRRRYDRPLLRRQLAEAGLEPVLMTHVFSWLVPPVWVTRKLKRGGQAELGLDKTAAWMDGAATVLTGVERRLLGRVELPMGTSLLCVARRKEA